MIYIYTNLMCLYRTVINMSKTASTDMAANGNNKENQPGTSGAGGGGGAEQQNPPEPEEDHNADDYNATSKETYKEEGASGCLPRKTAQSH